MDEDYKMKDKDFMDENVMDKNYNNLNSCEEETRVYK
jgi:hypothetical protein